MGINQFLPFATGAGANVESQTAYAADPNLPIGNQPGLASSAFNNKALRQACYIASQVAQFLVNQTGDNCNDDGTPANIQALMTQVWPAPTGAILAFAGSSAPTGFLLCNTSTPVSRTTYAALFAVIGTTYGVGDGSTTFGIPNLAGVFPRGAGTQTIGGIAHAATLGATSGDTMQGHDHQQTVFSGTVATGTGVTVDYIQSSPTGNRPTGNGVALPISDGTNGTPRTGIETAPANVAVTYIIKT